MVGFDHGHDAAYAESAERVAHDRSRGLGGDPASPGVGVEVVAELGLRSAVFQRLQAAVTDQAACDAVLDSPKAPAQGGLVCDLVGDLSFDVVSGVRSDPASHLGCW